MFELEDSTEQRWDVGVQRDRLHAVLGPAARELLHHPGTETEDELGLQARVGRAAYRMLGSLSEADDAVQESWLRLSRSNAEEIENLGGWLTTVVAWIRLNALRAPITRGGAA